MADASVVVNLTTISDADNDPAGFEKVGAGGQITGDADIYIQDSGGTTLSEVTTIGAGANVLIMYDNTTTITFDARDHLFAWVNFTAPAKLNTTANGGQRIAFGDGSTTIGNMDQFYVGGNEAEYLSGGWRCVVASPSATPQAAGAASAPYRSFGAGGLGVENVGKDNFFLDALRYGRGLQITDGDSTNPGTMKSFTDVNDLVSNQYGVARAAGAGANIQGEIVIGFTTASTVDTYFSDSNYAIFVPQKNPLSASSSYATLDTFTGFRIIGSATTCNLTNFTFSTNDQYDKGYLSCTTTYPFSYASGSIPAEVNLNGCIFLEWGQTQLCSTASVDGSSWVNSEAITLNNATLNNCLVETGVGGTYVYAAGSPNNITNTEFIGGGTGGGHAFEVTQSGVYSFSGNTFSNFGANGTDDAAVHINGPAGIAVTFNITGGGDGSFSYKLTGAGTTVSFVSAVTVNIIGLPDVTSSPFKHEIRILGAGTTNEIAGVSTESHETSTYSFSVTAGTDIDVIIINLDYVPFSLLNISADTDPTNIPVSLRLDRVDISDGLPGYQL